MSGRLRASTGQAPDASLTTMLVACSVVTAAVCWISFTSSRGSAFGVKL